VAKIAIVGLGNIGTVFAAHLIAGGRHAVTACVRRPPTQLIVESPAGPVTAAVTWLTDPGTAGIADWVLLCVKSQDTPNAAPWLAQLCTDDTCIAVLQNGVDQEERVRPFCARGRVIPTVVFTNSKRLGPGHVRHMRPEYDLGVPDSQDGREFAQLFEGSGIRVNPEADFTTAAWRKFLINVVANPLTAIAGRGIGILRQPDMESLARDLLREGVAVGKAAGARLDPGSPDEVLRWLAGFPAETGTSMWEDRQAGRSLEHEAITGTAVRLGREFKIPTPVNAVILALLRALDP
jgi:2-dehydropantoate 2-reductase